MRSLSPLRPLHGPGTSAGQHVDIRLTADNGYQAQRSYSIASPADAAHVELTVECVQSGEVSPFLTEELRAGDTIELRGPIGGYFTWNPEYLAAADVDRWRFRRGAADVDAADSQIELADKVPAKLLYSSRSADDIIYRDELDRMAANRDDFDLVHTLTRGAPAGWKGQTRRVDREMLARHGFPRHRSLTFSYVARPHSWRPSPISWSLSGMMSRPSRPNDSVQRETKDDRRCHSARWKRRRRTANPILHN